MPIKNAYFYSGGQTLYFPIVVITGVCRSGKTLLGNILATCPQVEYADEPWTAMQLPGIVASGNLNEEFASSMLETYFCELFNDLVLLRRANFRHNDLSSIWTKKTPLEMFERLSRINSRSDVVKFAKENQSMLLLTLSESTPFIELVCKAARKPKIIHVVRNGFDVGHEVTAKGWFTNERLFSPSMAVLYTIYKYNRDGQTYYLPWWVSEGEEDYFLELSEYERGVYYWCSLMEKSLVALRSCTCSSLTVYYENLVMNPQTEFERIRSFLGLTSGSFTATKIAEITGRDKFSRPNTCIDRILLDRLQTLNDTLEMVSYGR